MYQDTHLLEGVDWVYRGGDLAGLQRCEEHFGESVAAER